MERAAGRAAGLAKVSVYRDLEIKWGGGAPSAKGEPLQGPGQGRGQGLCRAIAHQIALGSARAGPPRAHAQPAALSRATGFLPSRKVSFYRDLEAAAPRAPLERER